MSAPLYKKEQWVKIMTGHCKDTVVQVVEVFPSGQCCPSCMYCVKLPNYQHPVAYFELELQPAL